jgi:hypothetical protein
LGGFERRQLHMQLFDTTKQDKRKTFLTALAVAAGVFLISAPVVSAATQTVKVKGPVNVRDTDGSTIESEAIGPMGLFQAAGSDGALAVRDYPGGGGVLGVGDCTASTAPAQGPLPNVVTVGGGHIITALLVTGTGTVRQTSAAVGQGQVPLLNVTVNADEPNAVLSLGSGLTTTQDLTFTGLDGTACNFVVLGI